MARKPKEFTKRQHAALFDHASELLELLQSVSQGYKMPDYVSKELDALRKEMRLWEFI